MLLSSCFLLLSIESCHCFMSWVMLTCKKKKKKKAQQQRNLIDLQHQVNGARCVGLSLHVVTCCFIPINVKLCSFSFIFLMFLPHCFWECSRIKLGVGASIEVNIQGLVICIVRQIHSFISSTYTPYALGGVIERYSGAF